MAESEPQELPHIPGYRLRASLGRGGMGEVYLAVDETVGRQVAVKRIAAALSAGPDLQAARDRFRREARAMARVSHPHLVQVHALGEHQGSDYLVMELVTGGTLADRIEESGRLPVHAALLILCQVASGLAAAWERGIVHRDVKPSNILFDRDGTAKVADFGLAKPVQAAAASQITASGVVLGSCHYMSPEQAREREVGFASDIYSLGIVLYAMLTGSPPGEGDSYATVLTRHLDGNLPDLAAQADVPAEVAALYRWMTRLEPARRPRSYADLIAAIDRLLAPAAGDGPGARISALPRTRPLTLTAAGALLALAAVLAWGPWPAADSGKQKPRRGAAAQRRVLPAETQRSPAERQAPPSEGRGTAAMAAEVPREARALTALRTGAFALRIEVAPGGPPLRITARSGRRAHLILFTLEPGGDLAVLHPAGLAADEPLPPGQPLRAVAAPGSPGAWIFLVATASPLAQPILLGARPEEGHILYAHQVKGREAIFPARNYLRWLLHALQASADRDLAALPPSPAGDAHERRTL